MSESQDKNEFIKICEAMEGGFPRASRLEILVALAFSLYKAVKTSPDAMAVWLERDKS
jgi:hypothetical protein